MCIVGVGIYMPWNNMIFTFPNPFGVFKLEDKRVIRKENMVPFGLITVLSEFYQVAFKNQNIL